MKNEKLLEELGNHNIRISKKGLVCLNDFVNKIMCSKNPEGYMKKIKDKVEIKGRYYISEDICVEILEHTNFKKCKEILNKINKDEDDHNSIIDPKQSIFQYDGHKFLAFFAEDEEDEYEWQVWVKGSDVAKYLGCIYPKDTIRDNVEKQNKIPYSKLSNFIGESGKPPLKNIDKQTIFINLAGFFNLIHGSKKPIAKKIKSWLDNEVLPSLVKHGSYSMQPLDLDIESFYDHNTISMFDNKAVVYIAYIGLVRNEHYFKYGISRNMFRRQYKEHSKHFKEFNVVFVGETDNCEKIETLFKQDLKVYGLDRKHTHNNTTDTELFTVSNKHSIGKIINNLQDLISKYKLPAIQNIEAENKLLTKRINGYEYSEEIRKMELEYKQSDNYRLELEYNLQMIKLQIEYQREKNKYIAMDKGFMSDNMIHINLPDDEILGEPPSKKKTKQEIIRL